MSSSQRVHLELFGVICYNMGIRGCQLERNRYIHSWCPLPCIPRRGSNSARNWSPLSLLTTTALREAAENTQHSCRRWTGVLPGGIVRGARVPRPCPQGAHRARGADHWRRPRRRLCAARCRLAAAVRGRSRSRSQKGSICRRGCGSPAAGVGQC